MCLVAAEETNYQGSIMTGLVASDQGTELDSIARKRWICITSVLRLYRTEPYSTHLCEVAWIFSLAKVIFFFFFFFVQL